MRVYQKNYPKGVLPGGVEASGLTRSRKVKTGKPHHADCSTCLFHHESSGWKIVSLQSAMNSAIPLGSIGMKFLLGGP